MLIFGVLRKRQGVLNEGDVEVFARTVKGLFL